MSTRFSQRFSRTSAPSLVREFGETVTYYPAGGGASRSIQAMVDRESIRFVGPGEAQVQQITVRVRNHATLGILSDLIDTGGDAVALPLRVGESAVQRSIVRVLSTENGLVEFVVE